MSGTVSGELAGVVPGTVAGVVPTGSVVEVGADVVDVADSSSASNSSSSAFWARRASIPVPHSW